MNMQKKPEKKENSKAESVVQYAKQIGKRKVILTFAGNDSATDLLICYAERKASLKF